MSKSKNKRKLTLGYFAEHSFDEIQSELMEGVFEAAKKHQVNIIRFTSRAQKDNIVTITQEIQKTLDLIDELKLDGLMFIGWLGVANDSAINNFGERFSSIPVYSLGSTYEKIPHIYVDTNESICKMVHHLIHEHNYTRIAFIAPINPDSRDNNYISTMKEAGLYAPELYVASDLLKTESFKVRAKEAVRILLDERKTKVDAIMSMFNDESVFVINELAERGLSVPKDIAVTSYEDGENAKYNVPKLTTINYPMKEMTFTGCEKFIERITTGKGTFSHSIPGNLIIRNSCGCILGESGDPKIPSVSASNHFLLDMTSNQLAHISNIIIQLMPTLKIDVGNLLLTLIQDLKDKRTHGFLRSFNHHLDSLIRDNTAVDVEMFETFLQILRKRLLPHVLRDAQTYHQMEEIFNKSFAVIAEKKLTIIGYQLIKKDRLQQELSKINDALVERFDVDSIFQAIATALNNLNIPSCFIFLFENKDHIYTSCNLAFEFRNGCLQDTQFAVKYPVTKITEMITDTNVCLTAHLIYINEEYKGVAFFEPGPMDERVYNFLSALISSALNSAMALLEQQQQNKILNQTLTSLTKTQEQLIQSEKMSALGALVAGVAHEINTPIGVSIMAITHQEKILKEIQDAFNIGKLSKSGFLSNLNIAQETAAIITSSLKRAAELVGSFKTVAVDQSSEEKRSFNIKEYIETTLLTLLPQLKNTQINISIHCDKNIELYSYPGQFSQIITNLVMNSLHHAFENNKGNIVFDVYQESEQICILYSDDGKGIKAEHLPLIFNPFFTTNRANGSTGLGLFVIYNLVTQRLGGIIKCESEEGKGCKFIILIDNIQKFEKAT